MQTRFTNHWLVGAMEHGSVDHTDEFVEGDYWQSFTPEDCETPAERRLWAEAKPGDRIGIKRRLGHSGQPIVVTTTGTVRLVGRAAKRVLVDWTELGMENFAESKGCMSTVCGPFGEADREWLGQLFYEEDDELTWAALVASSWACESDGSPEQNYDLEEGVTADEAR